MPTEVVGTGNGVTKTFSGVLEESPARGSLLFSAGPGVIAFDDREGNIIGNVEPSVQIAGEDTGLVGDDIIKFFQFNTINSPLSNLGTGDVVVTDGVQTISFNGAVPVGDFDPTGTNSANLATGEIKVTFLLPSPNGSSILVSYRIARNTINYLTRRFNFTFAEPPADQLDVVAEFVLENAKRNDFTVLSFEGLREVLTNLVQQRGTWRDLYNSNEGQTLIQLAAFVGASENFYVLRRAEESYILTARLRSSLHSSVHLHHQHQ